MTALWLLADSVCADGFMELATACLRIVCECECECVSVCVCVCIWVRRVVSVW